MGKYAQLLINFSGGRSAVVNVYTKPQTPFAAAVPTTERTCVIIKAGQMPQVTGADGRLAIKIVNAARQVAESGKVVYI
jgi:hypothetical protein